ncbi:MAG: NAD-dependent epimerase/dehydratase family protein [Anaerolineae bacterium]|nr:NAD-dependent epimerase/dehydratase family protein [Anaerolineae bacterium]
MSPKILVTGGTGFTGGQLCKKLAQDGYSVRALVRAGSRSSELEKLGIELVTGDLRDKQSLAKATEGVDTVYHIAALFRPENVTRQDMWDINVEGTRNILDASIEAGVKRFVHCSTIGVHGDIKDPPATEETPYGPGDYYQESKTEGEMVALQYMREKRLPIVVFRPGGIYGPGDVRFLKLFKSIKNKKFVMFGSGQVLYQLVHIQDLVEGIILCGTKEEAVGNIYILTGEEPITLNHLVSEIANVVNVAPPKLRLPVAPLYYAGFACEILCKPLGINPPIYRRRVDFFKKDRAFSIKKAKSELGFQPKVDLETGLKNTANWYAQQGLL